jgi:hypothetical protein
MPLAEWTTISRVTIMRRLPPLIGALLLAACRASAVRSGAHGNGITLRADSMEYTVRVSGPLYRTQIGYELTNQSGRTLSLNGCGGPPPPVLEKQEADSSWRVAYSPVMLMCLTLPPFRVANGSKYRGVVRVNAGRPGTNVTGVFGADSVPGIYRLRWALRADANPDNTAAPMLGAVSRGFRLVLR